jgi:hypothetical protein
MASSTVIVPAQGGSFADTRPVSQPPHRWTEAYGTANLCVTHRASDLAAQADEGSSTAKVAAGLLADAATKIILRQAPDQLDTAVAQFGLTDPEARIIGQLTRGRALWKLGGRTALVHHHLVAPSEDAICDTDARMEGRQATAEAA